MNDNHPKGLEHPDAHPAVGELRQAAERADEIAGELRNFTRGRLIVTEDEFRRLAVALYEIADALHRIATELEGPPRLPW